jgi:dihydrolipoyl dehydrogenase
MSDNYDIVIIGGGPGGYVAAIRASQCGLKAAIVEKAKMGGICLNWGCIPTKALLKSAEQMAFLKEADQFGFSFKDLKVDFTEIIKRSRSVADTNAKGVDYLMKKNKVTVIKGRGRLIDKSTISVTDTTGKETQKIQAKHIIIATGGRSRMLPGIEADGKRILTSTEALVLKKVPKSMIIIGAGAIGMEFAYFYHTFGTKVTIIEMMPQILPAEDAEVAKTLQRIYQKAGMTIHTGTKVESVKPGKSNVKITVKGADKTETITSETCLVAVGVQGNIEDLGLEDIGIKTDRGSIIVDKFMQTNVPGICAIGDVVGAPWLAHIASHEGLVCIDKIAGKETKGMNYNSFPGCTYCRPQIASIGLTEKQAKEKGYEIRIGNFPFSASGKARAIGETDGPEATEMIAEFGIAKTLESTDKEIAHTIHAHPTLSEAMMEAVLSASGEAIHI